MRWRARKGHGPKGRRPNLPWAAAVAALLSGCIPGDWTARVRDPSRADSTGRLTQGEGAALSAPKEGAGRIETLAIVPVVNRTGESHADTYALGRHIARRLAAAGRLGPRPLGPRPLGPRPLDPRPFRVIHPHELAAAAAPAPASRPAPVTDAPGRRPDALRAVAAADGLDADAVLVVELLEYRAYRPPRITLRARLYATGAQSVLGSDPLLEMTDDGVPAEFPAPRRRRHLWAHELVFDGGQPATRRQLAAYAVGRLEGADAEPLTWSMDRFMAFCADALVGSLLRDIGPRLGSATLGSATLAALPSAGAAPARSPQTEARR